MFIVGAVRANGVKRPGPVTFTEADWLTVPPVPVTVRLYKVVPAGETVRGVFAVSGRFPGWTTPVPLPKSPVSWALPPAAMRTGLAVKLRMMGLGFAVRVTVAVAVLVGSAALATFTVAVPVVKGAR